MINYDGVTKGNINKRKLNWPLIIYLWYRILILGGFGSEKINGLLNLIKQEGDDAYSIIDKIFLYNRSAYEAKLPKPWRKTWTKWFWNLKNSKAFIEYSNNIQDVHKKYEEFNQSRKCNVLIAFDDILVDMISNKKLNLIVP